MFTPAAYYFHSGASLSIMKAGQGKKGTELSLPD